MRSIKTEFKRRGKKALFPIIGVPRKIEDIANF